MLVLLKSVVTVSSQLLFQQQKHDKKVQSLNKAILEGPLTLCRFYRVGVK